MCPSSPPSLYAKHRIKAMTLTSLKIRLGNWRETSFKRNGKLHLKEMPAKVISSVLMDDASTLLRETGKTAMHSEETQAAV